MKIKVNLSPVPGSRPRVTRWGVYYGKSHTKYVKDVNSIGFKCIPARPKCPLEGFVSVNTTYVIPLPKSTSKKNKLQLDKTYCGKKTDLDNLNKLFWDSVLVDGGVIKDDSQIVESTCKKIWTSEPVGYTECEIKMLK